MNKVNYALIDLDWLNEIEEQYKEELKELRNSFQHDQHQYDQQILCCAKLNLIKDIRRNLTEFNGI